MARESPASFNGDIGLSINGKIGRKVDLPLAGSSTGPPAAPLDCIFLHALGIRVGKEKPFLVRLNDSDSGVARDIACIAPECGVLIVGCPRCPFPEVSSGVEIHDLI